MKASVRISVVKKLVNRELMERYNEPEPWGACSALEVGQEFVSENVNMPAGFCSWAWADIQKYVMALARGANMGGVKPGTFATCCTDGFRPVIFLLERIEPAP